MVLKKGITILAAIALVTLINSGLSSAQIISPTVISLLYDHDGDGIPNGQDPDFIRGTGQGIGDHTNFIDLDGDGICDNYQNGGLGTGARSGNRGQNSTLGTGTRTDNRGHNAGQNFIDADGEGVCDNAASGKFAKTGTATFRKEKSR